MMPRATLHRSLLLALAAGLATPALTAPGLTTPALAAQSLEGRVLDQERLPLPGVHVRLLDDTDHPGATAFSDDSGRFHLNAPGPGFWRLAADLLGHGSVVSDSLELLEADTVRVEVRMAVEPVRIEEPVVVIGRARLSPDIEAFHRRRQWGERTGMGHFLHGDQIRGMAGRPTDLLRTIPGVRVSRGAPGGGQVVQMRGRCVPAIYIDGSQINRLMRGESLDSYVDIPTIEGIEIYRGAQQPGGRFVDRTGCGLILVWTKRGERDGDGAFGWGRLILGVGLIAGLFFLF